MREHASWDPTAYGRFAGERSRPFADLVAQVRTDDPSLVVLVEAFDAARADSSVLAAAAERGVALDEPLLVRHHLVALPDEERRRDCRALAQALRARGIPADVAPTPSKYGKQIKHAEARGIPFVWFPGDGEGGADEVKDLRDGTQVPADARTWEPAPQDRLVALALPEG